MNKGSKSVNLGVFNSRSICNKTTAVIELLIDHKIDVGFITETWMKKNDDTKMAEFHERGLEIYNSPRKGLGGGVGFVFNPKRVSLVRNNVTKYSSFEVLETLLTTTTDSIRLCVVYRSTQNTSRKKYLATRQAKFFEDFADYLDCLSVKSGKPLLCGDFNFHVENSFDSIANQFLKLIEEKGFRQHVTEPTHISGGILDLVLTKMTPEDRLEIENLTISTNTGTTSDHFLVEFNIPQSLKSTMAKTKVIKTTRQLDKVDPDAFRNDIVEKLPHHTTFNTLCEVVDSFNTILEELLDCHAPIIEVTVKEKESPWLNAKCKNARRERRQAERCFKKNPSDPDLQQKFNEKQVDAAIIFDKQRNKYYTEKIAAASGDSKATYKIVNALFDKQYCSTKLPKGASDHDTAESMKNFFHNKVSAIYEDIKKSQSENCTLESEDKVGTDCVAPGDTDQNTMEDSPSASYFKLLVPSDIEAIIESMGNKTCALDPLPTWLLKNFLNELLPTITHIVNLSMQDGIFPKQLKTALVHPLLKKQTLDSDLFSSYRPVSNLTFLSKIIEKAVNLQLIEYLDQNELFPSLQSGYRKGHSCETAVLRIHNDILFSLDKQSHTCLMLIDLSAAFDTINHNCLLNRLKTLYNMDNVVLKWIKSYLSDRHYKVCINGAVSKEIELEIGVPQGSILGPLLFILYTKGLQSLAKRYDFSIHLYADDTQLYFELDPKMDSADAIVKLENCFTDIKKWMALNYLKMNDGKTEIMEIHSPYTSKAPHDVFNLDNCEIIPTHIAKNLGFWFDNHLNLEKQINYVSQVCYQNLRKIGRIGSKLTKDLKIQLVHSFIHSMIDYCNGTYFALTNIQLKKLQKIQNAATRFIFGLKGRDRFQPMTPLLRELHFLPVAFRIQFKISLLVFKCINNLAPPYLAELVVLRKPSNHSVRIDNDFYLLENPTEPRCLKTHGAFSYCGPKTWNNLPYNTRSLTNIDAFKCQLKTHLFRTAFLNDIKFENCDMNLLLEYEI